MTATPSIEPAVVSRWQDQNLPADVRVESLMQEMTLPEKVAQLGSAWEDVEPSGPEVAPGTSLLGVVGPLEQTAEHGIGQLTRPFGTVPRPAIEHARALARRHRQVLAQSRLGIPAMTHDECLTGVTAFGATIYPTPLGMAATFDSALAGQIGSAIGADLSEAGVHQGLAPVLDVVRDYRWGRCEETFGEDPLLVSEMGEAYVLGIQSHGVLATLKHFAGYSASGGGRNHAPVRIGPRELYDVVLPPFARLVDAGVKSVMNSYADLDGEAPASSYWLLTELLRDQWGFEGTVVSDYWSIPFLVSAHRVAADWKSAGVAALEAGMDVELPDQRGFGPALVESVREGRVDEAIVDRSLRRVLRQKLELGLLDSDWSPDQPCLNTGTLDLDKPHHRAIARRAAESGAVLLDNNGILPLKPARAIAVIGPCANETRVMFGCYSFPNHVLADRPELGVGVAASTYMEALAAALPGAQMHYAAGSSIRGDDRSGIAAAVTAAQAADTAVLFVGDQPGMFGIGTSGEGCDVEDLSLPGVQHDLVEAVLATGTPTVLVCNSGRPYALGLYRNRAAALVQVFLPGEEGGPALAGLLTGETNFSGRLPVEIPATPSGQPYTYLHAPLGGKRSELSNLDPTAAYPFGHGLSYTTFALSDLRADTNQVPCDGRVFVSVNVVNTGERPGKHVVQLYSTDPLAQVARPVRQLLAFAKVELDPGRAATVTFDVHTDRFAYSGRQHTLRNPRQIVEAGTIVLSAGHSSTHIAAELSIELTGSTRTVSTPMVHAAPYVITADS